MKKFLLAVLLAHTLMFSQTGKGIVTGRVLSMGGASPAAGIRVAAVARESNAAAGGSVLDSITQTDGSGTYRLENITPGEYYIIAGRVDLPTYYPGVKTQADAKFFAVGAGATVANVDFTMLQPAALKVAGRVTGALPTLPIRIISLLPRSPTGAPLPMTSPVRPDGTFDFANVAPGTYSISLQAARPVTVVVADRDVSGVEVVAIDTNAVTKQQGMKSAWSVAGAFGGLAADSNTGAVYATGLRTTISEFDFAGKLVREIETQGAGFPSLRLAHFSTDGGPAFLRFGTWSQEVRAYDNTGKFLWSYPPAGQGQGIDDVWAADLNGDHIDEVIVGFNGSTGLHTLNRNGEVLWKVTGIGNVWHVTGGELGGNPHVVTTSAAGRVHIFKADGSDRRDFDAGLYANMVRLSPPSGMTEAIVIAGSGASGTNAIALAALSPDGVKKWSLNLESNLSPSAYSASAAPGKPWVAVGMQGGSVYVLDVERGAVIASIDGQGIRPEVAWASDKTSGVPLLVVAAPASLNAYRIEVTP